MVKWIDALSEGEMTGPEGEKIKYDLLIITGPTASGKTALAAETAFLLNGEIISADSRQVYRRMDIGTGKDLGDYRVRDKQIPYHLIDIAEPGYKYNVFEYQQDFLEVFRDLHTRNVFPVVCGGSGMYIDSIVNSYRLQEVPSDLKLRAELEKKSLDELITILTSYKKLHNKTDIDSRKRVIRAIEIEESSRNRTIRNFPALRSLVVGVMVSRDTRRKRITQRLQERIEGGMIDEVKKLLDSGTSSEDLIYYGLEYKFITFYLTGKLTYEEMVCSLETAIHQFAKRQMTWFRGMERKGTTIHWIDSELPMDAKTKMILELLGR
jgi:tRNA dimethylallyltransferase